MKKNIYKKLLGIVVLGLLWCNVVFAGACNTTVTAALTEQLSCDDNDSLIVTGSIIFDEQNAVLGTQKNNVTISNSGTIKVTASGGGLGGGSVDTPIQGQSSLNLTVTNSGTIWAQDDYGIKLIEAEKVTITNEAGGTIKGTPDESGSQIAIGGTKMGNCSTCLNGSTTSSGEGLTLYNYGTIDANSRTVYGGHTSGHTSKKTKIYNYNGGMIDATSSSAVKFRSAEDFTLYNYSGATIQTGSGDYAVDLQGSSTITIDNAGTIKSGARYGVECKNCSDLTLTNSGTIEATTNSALFLDGISGTNTITNSGTITNGSGNAPITIKDGTGVTLVNSGTISSAGQYGMNADNTFSPTITNSGTISASADSSNGIGINLAQNQGENLGSGATITNSGTIEALGTNADGIRIGDGTGVYDDTTITNSGTIAAGDNSIWIDGSGTTGTNIITKGEATYTGEIDMESAVVAMTLDCSISKDMDIEIHNKTNMTITNNLCGNDTFEILDSSKNADTDNSETNGYLRVYGEDLDIDSHNKKFRSEIFLAKLNNIFTATDENKEQSTYYSRQKRDDIYKNYENGILGFFEKKDELNFIENPFISYSDQRASFNNSEYAGSKNLAIGFKKQIETEEFNVSIVPVLGLSQNKVVDVETETNQWIKKGFSSQFAGINTAISRKKDFKDKSILTIEVNGTYGIHRLPKYLTNFTDGDLSVDDAIDQVLGAGFDVKYSKKNNKGFVLEPYAGLSINNTLSNDVNIIADGENKEAGHVMNGVLARNAGLNLTKNNENFSIAINFDHQDQDGLIENTVNLYFSKKIQKISKIIKREESAIPELEKIFDQLQLAKENERLAKLAGTTIEENKVMKQLIIELLKENQKLKTENLLFKKN
tara:strand:+ start:159 stop:2801 length:2643 start_codon:yes stop_codon:yes gene_type:complete